MAYTLRRLAVGSYDLLLHGEVIGSLLRNVSAEGDLRGWRVELIEDLPPGAAAEAFHQGQAWLQDAQCRVEVAR